MPSFVKDIPEGAPSPRLCLVVKNNPSQEYGYNLHAERGKPQFIGTVDPDSPADRAGLRPGDLIFAVNGHSIIGENHKQVVQRIKENPTQCEMLVISEDGADWYKERSIPVTLSLPNIVRSCATNSRRESESTQPASSEQESSTAVEGEPQNVSPTPDANWYAPKEQEKYRTVYLPTIATTMSNKPRPRLCRLVKLSPSDEFGFNLHAEQERGHFVGAVDKGGIGELAGLEMGQRIVGVNGRLIYPSTPHKDVVGLIKMNPLKADLLVASEEVDRWYSEHSSEFSFDYVDYHELPSESRERVSHNGSVSDKSNHSRKEDNDDNDNDEMDDAANVAQSKTTAFSRVPLEESPIHVLRPEQEIIQCDDDDVAKSRQDSDNTSHTHRRTSSDLHGDEIVTVEHHHHEHDASEQHHQQEHIMAKKDELPSEPLNTEQYYDSSPGTKVTASIAPIRQPSPSPHYQSVDNGVKPNHQGDDIFMMSAKEARSKLVHRKKDPRRDVHMTLDEKYKLITNM